MKIVHKDHPALHTISTDVMVGDRNMRNLVDAMWMLMLMNIHNGIGLAANQLGITKRIIVVNVNGFKQEFINPVIVKRYGGQTTSREKCLSFPGISRPMIRHKQIIVEGFDRNWKPVRRKLKDLAAYCVQHEIDHLNGVTII